MKVKEKSKEYIERYLKCSDEYPFVDNHQRKRLIKVTLNRMGRVYQDGYRQAINDVCDLLKKELVDTIYFGATKRMCIFNKAVIIDKIKRMSYE